MFWLFRIARNLVIDHYRATSRDPTEDEDRKVTSNQRYDPGGRDNFEKLAIRIALTELPLRDQNVISFRMAGFLNREIAVVLDISEEAARTACKRALKRLGEKLEG